MTTATLTGRRALVTGGSRGIGAGIVRRLAADGAAVAFTYGASAVEADKLVAELTADGAKVVAIQADSADPVQVTNAVEQAVGDLGGLDVLVNNAGTAFMAPIEEFPQDQFDRLVAINADRVPTGGTAVYAMTKGAVSSLTRALARDLGPRGITVNNVQPGPIATDLNPDEGEFASVVRQTTALGRYGHTRDIAAVVSFLAGPESGYVTGANWNVDGGFTA